MMQPILMRTVVLVLLLAAGLARADVTVDAARNAYLAGDYAEAKRALARTEKTPGISDDTLGRVHWYRALLLLAEGDTAGATSSLDALLIVSPLFEPDPREAPPTTRALFQERARLYAQERAPRIGVPVLLGSELMVDVTPRSQPVARLRILARVGPEGRYSELLLPVVNGVAKGPLNPLDCWKDAVSSEKIELVLEAQRANGTPLVRLGSEQSPIPKAVKATNPVFPPATVAPPPRPVTQEQPTAAPESPARLVAPILTAVSGGLAAVLVLVGVVAIGTFVTSGAVMLTQPVPRRQSWWPATLLLYQSAFWAAAAAVGLSLVPLGTAAVSGVVWAVTALRGP